MAENFYEGMFILDASRYAQDPNGVSGQVAEMIEAAGGEVLVSRLWEERRLAYPIDGHRKGAYWLSYFKVEGIKIGELERKCQLSPTVVRVLFVKVDPRIIEPLVEHAKTGNFRPQTVEEEAAAEGGEAVPAGAANTEMAADGNATPEGAETQGES